AVDPHPHRVGVVEGGGPTHQLHSVSLKVGPDQAAQGPHHLLLPMHEVADADVLFYGVVDAIETPLAEPGEVEGGFPQGLAGVRWAIGSKTPRSPPRSGPP